MVDIKNRVGLCNPTPQYVYLFAYSNSIKTTRFQLLLSE